MSPRTAAVLLLWVSILTVLTNQTISTISAGESSDNSGDHQIFRAHDEPDRTSEETPLSIVVEFIRKLKKSSTYDDASRALSKINPPSGSFFQKFSPSYSEQHLFQAMQTMIKIGKEVLPKDGNLSRAKLHALAEELNRHSTSVERNFRISAFFFNDTLMNIENIDFLANLCTEPASTSRFLSRLAENGSKELTMLGRSIDCLDDFAKNYKELRQKEKEFMKHPKEREGSHRTTHTLGEVLAACGKWEDHRRTVVEFLIDEFFALLRSEANTRKMVTDFAVVMKALRNPSSYSNFTAFFEPFKMSSRLRHVHPLIEAIGSCIAQKLDVVGQTELSEILNDALYFANLLFPDNAKLNTTSLSNEIQKLKRKHALASKKVLSEIWDAYRDPYNYINCFLKGKEKNFCEKNVLADITVMKNSTNSKLSAIYAVLETYVGALRLRVVERQDTKDFITKVFTVKNALLFTLRYLSPSWHVKNELDEVIKGTLSAFDSLPAASRIDFVRSFPYRSLAFFSVFR